MKNLSKISTLLLMVFLLSIATSEVAQADDGGEEPKRSQSKRGPEFRQRMLKRFDADGDGKLSDDERAEARQEMRRHHRKRGSKGGGELLPERAPRKDFERPQGFDQPLRNAEDSASRGPRADKERRDGRNHRRHASNKAPNPNKMFDRFDADGNGQLSREEFHQLAKTMHRVRDGHKGHRRGKGHGDRSGNPGEGRKHGRRHDSVEGNPNRPRYRSPLREDRNDTSSETTPVEIESL